MRLNEINYTNALPIDGYGSGFFRVGGTRIEGAVIVGPDGATAWAGYGAPKDLIALVDKIDVLFLGTGAETVHVPKELRAKLENAGLAIEAMNSPAAARTYNVLLSEGRRIAVALLPVIE